MLEQVKLENFRSIESCEVALAPLTVVFGPTASGKSTLFYGLLSLRNFVLNPNQSLDGLFNLGFQNLGGFEACVFNHEVRKGISIATRFSQDSGIGAYRLQMGKPESEVALITDAVSIRGKISIPYGLNSSFPVEVAVREEEFTVNWNGLTATVAPKTPTAASQAAAVELATLLNGPVEAIKRIDICPHRRGFFKPSYTPVPLTPTPTSEDEVATIIINDANMPARVSLDTDDIFDRDFRTYIAPGTATVYLQTTEKQARTPTYLVNDGFGINQVVYMLAKIHRPDVDTVLIEEPEVHLHPTVIRRFARTACRLVKEEGKQLVFTTHSEHFLVAILTCVSEGIIEPNDLACYEVVREKRRSTFKKQAVSREGQIEGGLSPFMAGELEDLKRFLAITE